jgi:hypothetical protein
MIDRRKYLISFSIFSASGYFRGGTRTALQAAIIEQFACFMIAQNWPRALNSGVSKKLEVCIPLAKKTVAFIP